MSLTSGQFGALGLLVNVGPGVRQIDVDAAYDSAVRVRRAADQMILAAAELKDIVGKATERDDLRDYRKARRQSFRECYQEYDQAVTEAAKL